VVYEQTIVEGLENTREGLKQMSEGAHTGKLLVEVAEPGSS
jgi:NADPH-dependent curcumin reductase CurA